MSQAEVGAYIRLLCHQWNRGSIPVETEKQQRLAGGLVSADVLAKFRLYPDGTLKNERLEIEREKQRAYREQQAEKGRKSVESRRRALTAVEPVLEQRLNHGSSSVDVRFEPKLNSSSSSSSSLGGTYEKGAEPEAEKAIPCEEDANFYQPVGPRPAKTAVPFILSDTRIRAKDSLQRAFGRNPHEWTDIDDRTLLEATRARPDALVELAQILKYRETHPKLCPRSIPAFLAKWQELLDAARNQERVDAPERANGKPQPKILDVKRL